MRISILLIFALLAACSPKTMLPTTHSSKYHNIGTYYFEGDEVVFEFDAQKYHYATKTDGKRIALSLLTIKSVALAGEFNNWSGEAWGMKEIEKGKYQLRKKIIDFKDKPTWEFKYALNGGYYWAEPEAEMPTVSVKEAGVLGWYNITNQIFYAIYPDKNGNATFHLKGCEGAEKVILTGTFNSWDENALWMQRVKDGWELRIQLPPGRHEYKFIVDGTWIHDSDNPATALNEHQTLNSVYDIKKEVSFLLPGYANAQRVILSGSFCNWEENQYPMQQTPSGWQISLPLNGGKHLYKFIVDGEWVLDPANPKSEKTHDGYTNSVVLVH